MQRRRRDPARLRPAPSAAPSAASPPPSSGSTPGSPAATPAAPPPAAAPTAPPPLSPHRAETLSRDLSSRTAEARVLAGPRARIETISSLFILVGGDPAAPFDPVASLIQHTSDALNAGLLAHRPDHAVAFWVFSSQASFNRGLDLLAIPVNEPAGLGLYDPDKRTILTWTAGAGAFSAAHEAAHPLFEADFPHAPRWLAEGAPALFETVDFDEHGGFHAKAHFRLQTLRRRAGLEGRGARGEHPPRRALRDGRRRDVPRGAAPRRTTPRPGRPCGGSSSPGSCGAPTRPPATASLEDPTGVAAFTRVVGKSPADATAEWRTWIESREAEGASP